MGSNNYDDNETMRMIVANDPTFTEIETTTPTIIMTSLAEILIGGILDVLLEKIQLERHFITQL
jgi:uncharacterized PurR-regulated membrane protein YhhQ (DUF165 family)